MGTVFVLTGKRVQIKSTDKQAYIDQDIIGKFGQITRTRYGPIGHDVIGVLIDNKYNQASEYGVYWFAIRDLLFVDDENNESEDTYMIPEGYTRVAKVHLLDDSTKKDYYFALYNGEFDTLALLSDDEHDELVVVNPRGANNRVLGRIVDIIPVEDYTGKKPTAEVVGVVNMRFYNKREAEKQRLAELAEKKAAIEAELEKEINKRKSIEYYETMASKYSDNPKIAELVEQLKKIGEL